MPAINALRHGVIDLGDAAPMFTKRRWSPNHFGPRSHIPNHKWTKVRRLRIGRWQHGRVVYQFTTLAIVVAGLVRSI
jgi:hypothetical protein